jgi:hypothetical protein
MAANEHILMGSRPRRVVNLLCAVVLLAGAAACGASALTDETSGTTAGTDPAIALVATQAGLAGVPVGGATASWVVPGAVAAPDGSAVFAARPVASDLGDGFEVLRIDPRTGAEEPVGRHVPGPAGIRVGAVAPGGERLVLVAPVDEPTTDGSFGRRTLVMDFDPARGGGTWKPTLDGDLDPEALSPDRTQVYAARAQEVGYHVHVIDLPSGTQRPTAGRVSDKPEVMAGSVVQAVLSPDRNQLATLYRDSSRPDHTGFVHLLQLATGMTVCIDLHAPFGTAPPDAGADAIEWGADGIVTVGHTDVAGEGSVAATFDPAAIWAGPPAEHHHVDIVPSAAPPTIPAGIAGTPGFVRFVALAR